MDESFEKQVMSELEHMKKDIEFIKEHIADSALSDEEKQLLEKSYEHEKEGKLISSADLKKSLTQ